MTLRSDLEAARVKIVTELATMDQSKRTYAHGGQSENWDAHRDSLIKSLEGLNKALAAGGINLDESWEQESQGVT